jgi:HlyD family secretion protein
MAQKKKSILIYVGIGVVVLLVVLVAGKKAGWFGADNLESVSVEKASNRTIVETVSASGKIQPEIEVKISPDVSGEIIALYVKEGDKVKKGQLLVKIRPDVYESYLDRATASLNNTKANLANSEARFVQAEQAFKRNQKLHNDKVISDADFEQIKSNYMVAKADVEAARFNIKSAEASVKEAKDNLFKTTIFSPVDGTVSKLNVEEGERVVGTTQMSGTEMMRIANLNSMEVNVDVNENDINRLSLGDTATIEVDAFIDKKFKGIVSEIANSANVVGTSADQVTNFSVKIRVLPESYAYLMKDKSMPSPFRPGLSATVDIQTEKISNILTIPIQSVTTRDDTTDIDKSPVMKLAKKEEDKDKEKAKTETKSTEFFEYVFVVESGKVKMQLVKTGIQDDQYIQVLSGLKDGQEVVTAPYLAISKKLKNGSLVKVVKEDELFKEVKK